MGARVQLRYLFVCTKFIFDNRLELFAIKPCISINP
jgi:hypothetical protein